MKQSRVYILCLLIVALSIATGSSLSASRAQQPAFDVKTHYTKSEQMIPMRDGIKLFTAIYTPKDASQKYPIMLNRTPYSAGPYGSDAYRNGIGPSVHMAQEGYIFVYQDVRGRWMSEGEFID